MPCGPAGPTGATGDIGPAGPQGTQGTPGSAAFKGAWQSGATYSAGDIVFLAPTPNSTVSSCTYIALEPVSTQKSPFYDANPAQPAPNWLALDSSCYGMETVMGAASATTSVALSNFGALGTGYTTTATVAVNNTGSVPLTFTGPPTILNNSGQGFSIISTTCGSVLAVRDSCQTTVQFSPTTNTTYTGNIGFNFLEIPVQKIMLVGIESCSEGNLLLGLEQVVPLKRDSAVGSCIEHSFRL